MKVIKIRDARRKLARLRAWNRVGPIEDGLPRPWDSVRGTIVHALRDYSRRRIIRLRDRTEPDRPA